MVNRPKLISFFLRFIAVSLVVVLLGTFVTFKVNQELQKLSKTEQREYLQANTLLLPILIFVSAKTLKREKDR